MSNEDYDIKQEKKSSFKEMRERVLKSNTRFDVQSKPVSNSHPTLPLVHHLPIKTVFLFPHWKY